MGWYLHYLKDYDGIRYYSLALILFFVFEDGYILIQACKGQTSHFNTTTRFNRVMWFTMILSAVGISVWTFMITIKFFTMSLPELPSYYLWAIRIGLVMFVLFSLEGMMMGAKMAHSVGASDGSEGVAVLNWSKRYGDLRVAHFIGMHALQIIPLLSWYVIRSTNWTFALSIAYFLFTLFTLVQAISGKSFIQHT